MGVMVVSVSLGEMNWVLGLNALICEKPLEENLVLGTFLVGASCNYYFIIISGFEISWHKA